MAEDLYKASLDYHRYPKPGKLEIAVTKNMVNQRDLSLAYSPGVAAACLAIDEDESEAVNLTMRGNLVAVITNGTAVLGLGAIGPLASKPVMEGKAALFKKFAGIDSFDLELDTTDVDKFVDAVAIMEPSFGGINLEDIKAPECFEIEKRLRERMNIPVFHDDQHGTAICVAAAVRNGLKVANKKIEDIKLVCSGAGAAALACLNLLISMGLKKENVIVTDRFGVIYTGRKEEMNPYNSQFAIDTDARTLGDVIADADVFMGLSAPRVLTQDMVKQMARDPLILALANPEPEISPEDVHAVRDDAIIATGRSDYPNQVNNVLCFPFLFRAALDVGATEINEAMKIAAVEAIAEIANLEASAEVSAAYGGQPFRFGRDYLIPKPFDRRLMTEIPPRIAKAAMDSGVATRPIEDFEEYHRKLSQFVVRSGLVMKPLFEQAMQEPQRVVLAEGESERVIHAVQILVDDGVCKPILIGRPAVVQASIDQFQLRVEIGKDIEVIDPNNHENFERYWKVYHKLLSREGVTPQAAKEIVRTRHAALAALMVREGDADAMVGGVVGSYVSHVKYVRTILGVRPDFSDISAIMMLITPKGTFFLTDTHISVDPSADHIAETTVVAADVVRNFGMTPRAALLSHSNFGSRNNACSRKMRKVREMLAESHPNLLVEGEMHADAALSDEIRDRVFPGSAYSGAANLMVFPNLDAANIAYNMIKMLGDGVPVGPMIVGLNHPAHVLTNSATPRTIVNLCAVASVDAIYRKRGHTLSGTPLA